MNTSGKTIGIGILAAVVIVAGLIAFWALVKVPNRLVDLNEEIDVKLAQVDNQLQRRSDLIPNLVATVKGYAKQEKEIFTEIAEARSKLAGAGSVEEKSKMDGELSSALSRLLVVVENYPNLKSDKNFIALQDQLEGTENRLAVARKDYNDAVASFNKLVKKVFYRSVAAKNGYEAREYFKVPEKAKEVPAVNFE